MDDKIKCFAKKNDFITIKDYKIIFNHKTHCRLINSAKSEIGIVSKQVLERVNNPIRNVTNFNPWRCTSSVLEWFNRLKGKFRCKFINSDVVDFYSSINEGLLDKCLNFASQIPLCVTTISQ